MPLIRLMWIRVIVSSLHTGKLYRSLSNDNKYLAETAFKCDTMRLDHTYLLSVAMVPRVGFLLFQEF